MSAKHLLFFGKLFGIGFLSFFVSIAANGQCEKKKTRENIDKGNSFYGKNDFKAALESYDKALKSDPNCPLAFFNRGQAQRKLNQLDAAIGSIERAVNLNYSDKSAAYHALAAAYLAKGKDFSKDALKYAQLATGVNQNSLEAWYYVAVSNANLGQTAEELRAWVQVIRIQPANIAARRAKGVAHFKLSQTKEAVAEFQKLVELEPRNTLNYIVVSDVYQANGNNAEAVNWTRQALKVEPNSALAHFTLGGLLLKQKQYDDAAASYQTALRLKTEFAAESNYNLGLSFLALGRYDEAIAVLQSALREQPKYFPADVFKGYVFKSLGSGYGQLGKYRDAIGFIRQAEKLNSSDASADVDLSWWLSLLGENEAAVAAASQAIQKAPQQPMGFTNRCRANLTLGKLDEALADCQTAIKLNAADGETMFYYGRTLREKKRTKEADLMNRKAIVALEKELGVSKAVAREIAPTSVKRQTAPSDQNAAAMEDEANRLLTIRFDSPYKPYILGNAYFDDRQLNKAVTAYQSSLKRAPQFPLARFNLGIVYFVQSNKSGALEQYRELAKIDQKRAEDLKKVIDGK